MQARVDVTTRLYHVPAEMEERIRQKVERLERLEPRIQRCHVVIEGSGRHHPQGPVAMTVEMDIPSRGPLVSAGEGYDLRAVLRDVFKSLERRLTEQTR